MPMILFQVNRLRQAEFDIQLLVLTSDQSSDDYLCQILASKNIAFFRGNLDDVNLRYREALTFLGAYSGHFIRITADCPLICLDVIERGIEEVERHHWDYLSNTVVRSFPDGLDFEIVSVPKFLSQDRGQLNRYDCEHVTPFFYRNLDKYSVSQLVLNYDYSQIRLTVDYPNDLEYISEITKLDYFNCKDVSFSHLITLYNLSNKQQREPSLNVDLNARFEVLSQL